MIFDTVYQFNIYHYSDDKSNKVWGYFCHDRIWYAFWGGATQAMSFKQHGEWPYDVQRLAKAKEKKGYQGSTINAVLDLNPDWIVNFNDRFTWFKLLTSTDMG